jgi:hypothetical protein
LPLPQDRYDRKTYKQFQSRAVEAMPDEESKRLMKEHLRYAVGLTLNDRLTALRDHALGPGSSLVSNEVIRATVRARNELTHSSTKSLDRQARGSQLYVLAEYVDWLIRATFLRELGFAPELVSSTLADHRRFDWLRDRELS